MKYLLVALVVLVGLFAWRVAGRRGARRSSAAPPPADRPALMVVCAHCGLHLPRSEAISDDQGHSFCTDTHRRAGPR